ncbi:MAG: hypothetical protein KAG28_00310 [Cocleimonas sp.]|nr:hypothetical protein [Cocleimonas sp.]
MGELIYSNQQGLQRSLNKEFIRLYSIIQNTYHKHGSSDQCSKILKQFAEYFYRQTIKRKPYLTLRSQLIRDVQTRKESQKHTFFSNETISGCLYALPVSNSLSLDRLKGDINILTLDYGAIQIEQQTPHRFKRHSQRLTTGQSFIGIKNTQHDTQFYAKTNVALFLSIAFDQRGV